MSAAREHRGLKMAGLGAAAAAVVLFQWALRHAEGWPLPADRLAAVAGVTLLAMNLLAAGLLLLAAGCGAARWRSRRERRALALQLLLANLLAPAALYGLLTADVDVEQSFAASGWDGPLSLGAAVIGVVAWRMWRRSQRHVAPDASEAMAADPRPPILYLRSFKDDGTPWLADVGVPGYRHLVRAIAPRTPEQEIAAILTDVGPVIAIGRPGEPLPELGAARLYVPHDEWQARVAQLMREAALVVIRVGASAGVQWELDEALRLIPRQRLVLAVQDGVAPAIAERLAAVLGASLSAAWPEQPRRGWRMLLWRDPRRRIGSLVCFPTGDTPHVVPIALWPLTWRDVVSFLPVRPSAPPLRYAWRQVFAALGLEPAMDVQASRATAVVLAILWGAFGAHWFYLGNRRRGWKYVALFPVMLVSFFLGLADAVRFLWVDRAAFDARFVASPARRLRPRGAAGPVPLAAAAEVSSRTSPGGFVPRIP